MEAASLYILQTMLKGFVYSVKLKLELAVLGKLVKLVGGSRSNSERSSNGQFGGSVGFVRSPKPPGTRRRRATTDTTDEILSDMDVNEFVDLSRYSRDNAYHPQMNNEDSRGGDKIESRRQPTVMETEEFEFARFEHVEDVRTLCECSV